jgi:peptidoglycan/LPS O-acetylase OafA/YrhL
MTTNPDTTQDSSADRGPIPPPHLKYRADIDGLRAVAVLTVVGFHAFPDWVFGGFIGVDVFFVISGYLISTIILKSFENDAFTYRDFYTRRIKRIFPAFVVVLMACVAFGWYVLLPDEFTQLLKHSAAGSGFTSNFVLWSEADYFDNSADTKPLLHLWSLAIEEQFYIVWPLLVGLVWRRKWSFLALTLTIIVVSFAINVMTVTSNPTAAYYSPLSRFWELMIGGTLAYITLHRPHLVGRRPDLQATVGLAAIIVGTFLISEERPFPGWWALLPTIGAFLVISGGSHAFVNRFILSNRLLVWIGRISYPLYLWHWPVLVFAKITAGRNLYVRERILLIVLAVVLADLTYRLVETPVRSVGNRGIRSTRVVRALAASVGCMLVLSVLAFGSGMSPRQSSASISKVLAAAYDWEYPDGLKGKILAGSLRRAYAYDGNLTSKTLFIGDSNMEQYYPRVTKVISSSPGQWNSAIFVGNQRERCNPMYQMFLTAAGGCDAIFRDVNALANRPDVTTVVLIFSGAAYHHLLSQEAGRDGLSRFLETISRSGRQAYLVLNMPDGEELDPKNMFTGSRLGVLAPKPAGSSAFNYRRFMEKYSRERSELTSLVTRSGGAVIDPLPHLCSNTQCPVLAADGSPLYKDKLHMRASYARASATHMDATLRAPRPGHQVAGDKGAGRSGFMAD